MGSKFMIFTFASIVAEYATQADKENIVNTIISKWMKIVSVISLLLCVIVTWCIVVMVSKGHSPFGMELALVGPFLNWQFEILFFLNLVLLILSLYQYAKKCIHDDMA